VRRRATDLRTSPEMVTVLSLFCRLSLRRVDGVNSVAASITGKSKVRLKQIIRIILLNGVGENVSIRDRS
jgi:hypothetical protein